ncbi:MAG: hypothetical protein LBP23_01180 [Treponema sp.]|jgi:hypothetical protein|nr:hypothetical protein [Treponema sp.]
MEEERKKKKPKKGLRIIVVLLIILILLPLILAGLSFIGRIGPGSVIPDSYSFYGKIPNPVRLADNLLAHESLSEILNRKETAPLIPFVRMMDDSGVLKNRWIRFIAKGTLEGALLPKSSGETVGETGGSGFLPGNRIVAAWDAGILSPLLRLLPVLAPYISVPGLYYVQGGSNSRFEYRVKTAAGSAVFYIGPYHNLLVVSDDAELFESVLDGTSRDGDIRGSIQKPIRAKEYDAVFLIAPGAATGVLAGQDARIAGVLSMLRFPQAVEAALTIAPKGLNLSINAAILSGEKNLEPVLGQNSKSPAVISLLPASTQYGTILSAGTLRELMDAFSAIGGSEWARTLRRADNTARAALGMNLEELLHSWTENEFAVFGLEGRPNPIYAIRIGDEKKRQEIFDRAFKSVMLNENIRLNLDGMRIPRIQVPEFLASLLLQWNIRIPSPFYYVHEGYLFVCESAETLQSCIRGIQRNEALPKTAVWQNLSQSYSDNASFSLYYSLDRSLPFFLKGSTVTSTILGLYRQGLLRLGFEDGNIYINLSVISGSGGGLSPMPGYPLDVEGTLGNRLYSIHYGKIGESRIFFTRDTRALALNPGNNRIYEYDNQGPLWVIPAEDLAPKNPEEGSAWVVSAQGRVILVNGNMTPLRGFPVATGLRISAAPAAHGGNLYLCDEDGRVYTINPEGGQNEWGTGFTAALRAPPSFLSLPKTNASYAAVYPKSFMGEIWLLDGAGRALPGWPVYVTGLWADREQDRFVSGIAFGAPPVFAVSRIDLQDGLKADTAERRKGGDNAGSSPLVAAAFVTQTGELSVHDEGGNTLPGFPVALEGVFFLQPVFDGEFLWLLSSEGMLYQVSLDAVVLRQQIPNLQVKEESCLIAADCDGDGVPEIFFSGEGNALYGYARNFSSLDGFPLPVWGRPAIGDFNGDGKTEIAGAGLDNRIYRWQFK